jgi:hypothetical protein
LVLRSVSFSKNRVRSIDDQKRIIVPDWMDWTEVPETPDEPSSIAVVSPRGELGPRFGGPRLAGYSKPPSPLFPQRRLGSSCHHYPRDDRTSNTIVCLICTGNPSHLSCNSVSDSSLQPECNHRHPCSTQVSCGERTCGIWGAGAIPATLNRASRPSWTGYTESPGSCATDSTSP